VSKTEEAPMNNVKEKSEDKNEVENLVVKGNNTRQV